MRNADLPAMPQPIAANETEVIDTNEYCPGNAGLTKREHFAGLAMQGLYMVTPDATISIEESASIAVSMADALLYELEKKL